MKCLKRNMREFTYTPCLGKTEIMSGDKHTGKFTVAYGDPVSYQGTFSVPGGQANRELFGIDTKYTHVLLMDNPDADIREDGLIQYKGSVYDIKAIRDSLNVLAIALMKRTGDGSNE